VWYRSWPAGMGWQSEADRWAEVLSTDKLAVQPPGATCPFMPSLSPPHART
jgi:hypothetical protein